MSFLPGEKLRYAESHFKFKLPWSFLYRPWPEIIVDAPFQVVPTEEPTIWVVVRDGDRFPTKLKEIEIQIESAKDCGRSLTQKISLNIEVKNSFTFFPISLGTLPPGSYKVTPKIQAERNGILKTFSRWNLPGLKPKPLYIQVLEKELPKAPGFLYGEMHCHTYYSVDHVEYGASPAVMQQAAKSIGLDFVNFTDHAYDFAFAKEDYTKEAESPISRFQELQDEIRNLPSLPLLMAGEEVSVGNSKGENVHMTVLGQECFLPGLGDCGRYWLANKPTRPIAQILNLAGGPCFAAHPWQQMSALERFVFRRGFWHSEDLHLSSKNPIRGIQFWNGLRDEGFHLGRNWWIRELGKGNYLLPIGGNDAHGDLNDTTSVSIPLFKLRHTRDHVFGQVRTAIFCQDTPTQENLKKAFLGDNCFITDGPSLWWNRNEKTVTFHGRSNSEMGGGFRYVKIYGRRILANGKVSSKEEVLPESLIATTESVDITIDSANFAYLRCECETASGRFALTSAARTQIITD